MSEIIERIKKAQKERSPQEHMELLQKAGIVDEQGEFLEELASRRPEEPENSDKASSSQH
jgi:hypothetical protein